ncbi:uncharacterized protein LOC112566797 [Pomacea canaliculata]|uniref:uncharacterized protein LOC112566797 n=1 Tax=Pomacea canaliculata TaxID=400727 RepID=UPI000D7319A7|nr:uncharacterized protein LOC112566797 [Pomacea canaliculata]XP_025098945.1 uncharacterized protein LOC112566797 [Pomacea canaliculata]
MVRSKLDCVRRCFSLTSCVSLTYMAQEPDMASCVCLPSCSATNRSVIASPGTVYINMWGENTPTLASGSLWLNKTCTYAEDCSDQNAICYNTSSTSICLCTPGYFYSNSCNTCVPECDQRNLLDTFVEYKGGCLYGYDDITFHGVTHGCVEPVVLPTSDVSPSITTSRPQCVS